MSMNLFFRAFTAPEIEAMEKDHSLIDPLVEGEKYSLATDIETAWDVLQEVLGGVGILVGNPIDDALFNGCTLISAAEVKHESQKLSRWTHEQVVARLQKLNKNADIYHLELYQEDEESLLTEFDCLVAFYQEAAEKNLGVLSYAA
jgi:hypothetical protein